MGQRAGHPKGTPKAPQRHLEGTSKAPQRHLESTPKTTLGLGKFGGPNFPNEEFGPPNFPSPKMPFWGGPGGPSGDKVDTLELDWVSVGGPGIYFIRATRKGTYNGQAQVPISQKISSVNP